MPPTMISKIILYNPLFPSTYSNHHALWDSDRRWDLSVFQSRTSYLLEVPEGWKWCQPDMVSSKYHSI